MHLSHNSCTRDMTHSHLTWRILIPHNVLICDMTDSHVTWLFNMWRDSFSFDMNYSYACIRDTTHSNVTRRVYKWHDSFTRDMTHPHMTSLYYSPSHLGWHFRKLFKSSKLKARMSLFTETRQKRRSSFELWALKQHSKMSPQVG